MKGRHKHKWDYLREVLSDKIVYDDTVGGVHGARNGKNASGQFVGNGGSGQGLQGLLGNTCLATPQDEGKGGLQAEMRQSRV